MKKYIYTERVDLFEPNIYIQYLVQIVGNPASEALVSAVKTAFTANEATMSRVVFDENGDAFYEPMLETGCKVCVRTHSWKDIIRQNEKEAFAIDKGELMRAFVITQEDNVYLLIMAHHLVGDGKAVTYFIEDVMMALSGKSLEYKPIYLLTKDSFPKKSKLPIFYKLYVANFNRRWKRTGRTFNWKDYYVIHEAYWEKNSSEIMYEHFSTEEINRIHAHAKKIGVSVNSYITAAFLEANRDNKTIGMAVNIRHDHNKSLSNQASGISVDHIFSDKKTFDENVQIIHQKVLFRLKRPVMKYFVLQFMSIFNPNLVDSVLLYTYGLYKNKTTENLSKVLGYTGEKTRELGITNLTKLDIPNKYGTYGLKNGLFIPPVVSYANHIIGVSTMEDGMTISYHFMSDQEKEKELEFFQRGIRNIRNNV